MKPVEGGPKLEKPDDVHVVNQRNDPLLEVVEPAVQASASGIFNFLATARIRSSNVAS